MGELFGGEEHNFAFLSTELKALQCKMKLVNIVTKGKYRDE